MKKINIKRMIAASGAAAVFCAGVTGCGTAVPSEVTPAGSSQETVSESVTEASEETEAAAATAGSNYGYTIESYPVFELSSESLTDGVWSDDGAGFSDHPEGLSPELSWEPVEGAECYIIYMLDTYRYTGIDNVPPANLLHWKVQNFTDTHLDAGADSNYLAMMPPPGETRTYDIYVIALKNPVERAKGGVRGMCPKFNEFLEDLDTDAEGNSGNIISYGYLQGRYTGK